MAGGEDEGLHGLQGTCGEKYGLLTYDVCVDSHPFGALRKRRVPARPAMEESSAETRRWSVFQSLRITLIILLTL